MKLSENSRVSATLATAASIAVGLVGAGITYGVAKSQVETLQEEGKEIRADVRSHEQQLAEVRAQYTEILRRLDRIDRKLERQNRE